jgi:cell fate (sporulation/competence/biofilm development) regulator YlbF (YheA/YmcA/DUF963 family)
MLQDKAMELGRLIGQSDEYKAVMRANAALSEDTDAVALLKEMEQLRRQAQEMLARGEDPTPEMEQQLDGMLSKIQVNPSYQRVAVAQENLDKIMRLVNDWISEGITKGAQSPIITLG